MIRALSIQMTTIGSLLLSGALLVTPVLALDSAIELQFKEVGEQYLKNRDIDIARQGYILMHQQNPSYAPVLYNLARLSEQEEEWSQAIHWYQLFLQHNSDTQKTGVVKVRMLSLKEIQKRDADPKQRQSRLYEAAIQRAQYMLEQRQFGKALSEAEQASDIDPKRFEAYLMAATLLLVDQNCAQAEPFFSKALERATLVDDKGLIKESMQYCDQEQSYKKTVKHANTLAAQKKYADAARLFEQAWQNNLHYPDSGLAAANYYSLARQYEKSRQLLNSLSNASSPTIAIAARRKLRSLQSLLLLRASSDIPEVTTKSIENMPGGDAYLKGVALLQKGKLSGAKKQLDMAIKAVPFHREYGYFFYRRGEVNLQQNNYRDAINDLRMAALLSPDVSEIYQLLGRSYQHEKAYDEAIKVYGKGLFFAGKSKTAADFLYLRGEVKYTKGDYASAQADIADYLEQADNSGQYWEDAEKLLAIIKTATDMQQALNPDSVTPKTKPRPAKNRNTTKKTEAIHKNNSNPFSDALSNF